MSAQVTDVIWNPSAGSATAAENVYASLQARDDVRLHKTTSRENALQTVIDLANAGASTIVSAGGDGSLSTVIAGIMLADQRPTLGIIPLGTGNDLARSLGISLDTTAALEVLDSHVARPLDLVHCTTSDNSLWYANMLTAGNTGRYMEFLDDDVKKRWGPLCYIRGVITLVAALEVFEISVTCDDGPEEVFEVLNIFAANGKYSGGGLSVSPEAEVDDGLIDLIIVKNGPAFEITDLTKEYVMADYLQHDLVEFRRAEKIQLTCKTDLPMTADGDIIGNFPVDLKVSPSALQVLAPQR